MRMTRRQFLSLAGGCAAAATLNRRLVGASEPPKGKPNVVLLFADDMNYGGASCYGDRWGIKTPNIDRLATEGVRFTDAYVTAPTCGPSRAGLITGRYQQRFGHEFNSALRPGIGLPLTEETIADRLKALGYATGIIGKWHLGGCGKEIGPEYHPTRRGFDEFFGFSGSMTTFFDSGHLYEGHEPVREEEYLTDAIARRSCDFIERHKSEPFFLYVPFNAVHTPLEAAEADLQAVGNLDYSKHRNTDKARKRAAMLRGLDRGVGRILKVLKTHGLEENTLVFFINDNGDYSSNGPFSGSKGITAEGGIRVPYLLRWPGRVPGGKVYRQPVSTLDVLPTAVAAAGGQVDPAWKLDGVDLVPYLTGRKDGPPHEWLFWRMGDERAARTGRWKIRYNGGSGYGWKPKPGETRWSLYDLDIDPAERRDLKDDRPDTFQKMLAAYEAWDAQLAKPLWRFGASGQMGKWKATPAGG